MLFLKLYVLAHTTCTTKPMRETETLIIYIDFSAGKINMRISDLKLFSLSIIFDNLSRKLKYAFLIKITCSYFRRLLFALPLIQFQPNLVNCNFWRMLKKKTKAISKREILFWNFNLHVIQMYRRRTIEQKMQILTAN